MKKRKLHHRYGHAGKIPLEELERRARRLTKLVKSRGGRV